MTNARLLAVYRVGLLLVLFGVVVHAPLSVWFSGLWPDYTELLKAWKEILLFGLSLIAIILLTREKKWQQVFSSRLVQLCTAFIVLHLLLLPFFWHGLPPSIAGLMIDLRFIAAFLLFYVLTLLEPGALKSMVKTVGAGAIVMVGFGLLQITVLPDDILTHLGYSKSTITPYSTIDKNPDFVRINSTTRGPNPLGAMMVLYISLTAAWLVGKWRKLPVQYRWYAAAAILAAVAVLFASFSRSAYLALVISLVMVGVLALRLSPKKVFVGLSGLAIVSLGLIALLGSSDWFANVVLHEDPESTVVEKSNTAHLASLEDGVTRMARQPLGAGIGSTGSAVEYGSRGGPTIENYYLFVAHEAGWLGLVGFIMIAVLIFKNLYRERRSWLSAALLASGIGLAVIGLLLPVWTDETVSITWWALAGGIIGAFERRNRARSLSSEKRTITRSIIGSSYAKRTRQQKATRTP